MLFKTHGKTRQPLKVLLYCLSSIALAAFFASNAQAIPSKTIDITITYNTTPDGFSYSGGYGLEFFESPTNTWASYILGQPIPWTAEIISGNGTLSSGVTVFEASLSATDLSNIYMSLSGSVEATMPSNHYYFNSSIFVASTRPFQKADAWNYGPPWISLANLDSGLTQSGNIETIEGHWQNGDILGTWRVTEVQPVPEPSSFLLIGAGLTVLGLAIRFGLRQDPGWSALDDVSVVLNNQSAPVPEPGTMALLGLGMAGLAVYGKRRKNNKA